MNLFALVWRWSGRTNCDKLTLAFLSCARSMAVSETCHAEPATQLHMFPARSSVKHGNGKQCDTAVDTKPFPGQGR